MAKPIEATPALRGKEASAFWERMRRMNYAKPSKADKKLLAMLGMKTISLRQRRLELEKKLKQLNSRINFCEKELDKRIPIEWLEKYCKEIIASIALFSPKGKSMDWQKGKHWACSKIQKKLLLVMIKNQGGR